jgi:hypothetical protein
VNQAKVAMVIVRMLKIKQIPTRTDFPLLPIFFFPHLNIKKTAFLWQLAISS